MNKNNSVKKHWDVIKRDFKFKGDWIDLSVDKILLPDGSTIDYEALHYQKGGVGIVAENERGEMILVKNYRYINDFTGWEVPAGTIPHGQHHSDCILQELKEEAGCEVSKESLTYLGDFYPSIGSSNQHFYCYYAKGVKQVYKHQDTNEILETKWFSKDEVKMMMKKGEIKDGFSLNLLMRAFLGDSI